MLGGHLLATGLLKVHVATTTFRSARPGSMMIAAVSGLVSIGGMAVTNFVIHSGFRWWLQAFTVTWVLAPAPSRAHVWRTDPRA